MKAKRLLALLCAASMAFSALPALCETASAASPAQNPAQFPITVEDFGLELMGHSIHYPQLNGMPDPAAQEKVNAQIIAAGSIDTLTSRLPLVLSSSVPLNVSYRYLLAHDLFSCAISCRGPLMDTRSTHLWGTVNLDLATGETLPFSSLFTDLAQAENRIEALLLSDVQPLLSAHLQSDQLLPLPAQWTITPEYLTLYYPITQFQTLSDNAGTVVIWWNELRELLDLSVSSPLHRLQVGKSIELQENSAELIAKAVEEGSIPGLPIRLGGSVQEATDRYHLLTDPDLCESGRLFALEDGVFRDILLMTDALAKGWAESRVNGLRCMRGCLYGLCLGETSQQQWREVLGSPVSTLQVDAERADAWRICPGTSDYYQYGGHRLRLHADEQGILRYLFITQ